MSEICHVTLFLLSGSLHSNSTFLSHPSATLQMLQYSIFCILADSRSLILIDIENTKTVAELKDAIKVNAQHELRDYDAHQLKLYKIDVPFDESDKQEHFNTVQNVSQDLTNYKLLHPWVKLSTIEHGFGDGLLHILIELPAGESIQ